MQRTIETLLAAELVAAGTVIASYPDGFSENHFAPVGHKISIKNGGNLLQGDNFSVTLNADSATITLGAGEATIPAGSTLFIELRLKGNRDVVDPTVIGAPGNRVSQRQLVEVNFGAPIAADPNGVAATQSITAAAGGSLDGALVTDSVATFDVPRNVVAAWTTAAVMTVTGTDEYGNVIVESSASGTAMAGKKAFKTITAVDVSVDVTLATVGTGDVLGLPIFLPNSAYVLKELEDGAAATAGTVASGVITKPTATTGDVRGSYDPNSACDGAANFAVLVSLENPEYLGASQYAG